MNYPNGDMVGHTGIEPAVQKARGVLLVTADHGNADVMFTEKDGKRTPHVAHTLNPVPFIVKDFSGLNRWALAPVDQPGLGNVAATVCLLLGFEPPADYDRPHLTLQK